MTGEGGAKMVWETSVIFNQLAWLVAQKDFINFGHYKSFISYNAV
jgi:hypothetical protein